MSRMRTEGIMVFAMAGHKKNRVGPGPKPPPQPLAPEPADLPPVPGPMTDDKRVVFSEALFERILHYIRNGWTLSRIAKLPGMPYASTIRWWGTRDPEHSALYAQAREECYHYWAEETQEIADDGRNDTHVDENGKTVVDQDVVQRSRLRVDTRKWLAGKLLPRVYGDKTQVEMSGPEGKPIEIAKVNRPTAEQIIEAAKILSGDKPKSEDED